MSLSYKLVDSPVGLLKLVASEKALVAVLWENDDPARVRLGDVVEEPFHRVLVQTEKELKEYFWGEGTHSLYLWTCVVPLFKRRCGRFCWVFLLAKHALTATSQSDLEIPQLVELWEGQTVEIQFLLLFHATESWARRVT